MESTRYQQIKELVFRVSELAPEARERFLAEHCRDDPELLHEVEALAAFDDGELLSPSARSLLGTVEDAVAERPSEGERLQDRYVLGELLGEGSLGSVREALGEVALSETVEEAAELSFEEVRALAVAWLRDSDPDSMAAEP